MQVCAAWLSLLLAGPGLAAPPASPAGASEATQDRIFTVIKESDPEEMLPPRTPRPLSELVEAAELAAAELARATPTEVYELLSLLHDARGLAYRLSGRDAAHLCAELGALAGLMQRKDLEELTAARVKRLDVAGRSALAKQHAGHVCEELRVADETSSAPSSATQALLVSSSPSSVLPPAARPALRSTKASSAMIVGGVLLAVAGGLAIAVAPVQASRVRLRDDAGELRDEVNLAGGATPEQARAASEYDQAADRTRLAMTGLSVSSAALAVAGVVLVLGGVRKQRRLELVPQGGPQGAALALKGRF